MDKNDYDAEDSPLEVKDALKESVSRGRIGGLKVDPASLSFGGVGECRRIAGSYCYATLGDGRDKATSSLDWMTQNIELC